MAQKIKRNKEFLMLAVVSVLVIVGLLVAGAGPSGHAAVKKTSDVTHSSTGTIWTCTWDSSGWVWTATLSDGAVVTLPDYINAESQYVNCDEFYWKCQDDESRCHKATEGNTCICRQQKDVTLSMGAST